MTFFFVKSYFLVLKLKIQCILFILLLNWILFILAFNFLKLNSCYSIRTQNRRITHNLCQVDNFTWLVYGFSIFLNVKVLHLPLRTVLRRVLFWLVLSKALQNFNLSLILDIRVASFNVFFRYPKKLSNSLILKSNFKKFLIFVS